MEIQTKSIIIKRNNKRRNAIVFCQFIIDIVVDGENGFHPADLWMF
jgi:hypothetical protein